MKTKMMPCSVFAFVLAAIFAFAGEGDDKKAVMKVIEDAYVKGVHAQPSGDAMRQGFHPEFIMFVLDKGEIRKVTRDEWIARIEKASAQNNGAAKPDIKHEFPLVEITGNAAVVKVELYRDGKHIFSDYISLYKFEDGWKLVGKIFYRHPA
jgi:hypothetical protein